MAKKIINGMKLYQGRVRLDARKRFQGYFAPYTPLFPKGLSDTNVGSSLFSGHVPDVSYYHR